MLPFSRCPLVVRWLYPVVMARCSDLPEIICSWICAHLWQGRKRQLLPFGTCCAAEGRHASPMPNLRRRPALPTSSRRPAARRGRRGWFFYLPGTADLLSLLGRFIFLTNEWQGLSTAGLQRGLGDERSALVSEIFRVYDEAGALPDGSRTFRLTTN